MANMNWNDLFLTGSIIDIQFSSWRARAKIKPQDLGIEDSEEVAKVLSLGCHRLAPSKAFENINLIAGQAKRSLEYHSLNFAMIRGARYVPNSQLQELLGKLRDYKKEYTKAVEEFVENYEKVKEEMLPVIEKALKDAARHPDAARGAFERIQAEYPTSEEVKASFAMSWAVYAIQSPKSSAAKTAAADETDNIKGVVRGMVEQLRADAMEKLTTLSSLMSKGGKLPKQSIDSAKAMIARIDQLNVVGDRVLSEQTRQLMRLLDAVEDEEQRESVAAGFEDIKKILDESVEQAVKDAEDALTGVGKRKLAVD